jgi:hypothetical protein
MAKIKAGSDRTRRLCLLPREIREAQPGLWVPTRSTGLLVTALPPRPHGLSSVDEPIVEALHAAVLRFADRLDRVSWIFAFKEPVAVDPVDPDWLKHWLHSHHVIPVRLPALMQEMMEVA